MSIWKSYRVADVINEIEDEKFVLPVIQRRLVWDEEKMELLFDTLLKGDSFGGIIIIEEEKNSKPLFNFRPFTKDGEIIASRQIALINQTQYFVIDGQQRLQSFYIGLKGSINGKVLYFDLFSDYRSEFEFKFENDSKKLPASSKENIDRPLPEHFWYLSNILLKKLKDSGGRYKQVVKEIIDINNVTDDIKKEHIEENILAFYENVINAETLGISKVIINKLPDEEINNKQKIVELFRRLNDGGTKLSSFDLVASILKGFSWEMEGFLDETLKEYQDIGLNQDNLIKLIFILQDNHKKEMASIEGSDANFAITNRKRIGYTLKALKDFLIYSKLYDYYKEGNRSFIPLFFIAYHLFHKDITDNQIESFFDNYDTGNSEYPKIKSWVFHSLINGVFKSKGAGWIPYKTGIKKILETISLFKNKSFPIDNLFEVYTNHPITFTKDYNSNNLDQLDNSFVYYLMYDKIQTIRVQDIDHIMPKSILESKKYDPSKINSIKNFQLIDYGTNRGEKNGKPFKEWINNVKYVADKNGFISKHLIPDDENLWIEDRFDDFIEKRAEKIISKIKDNVG